jgi:hypothetical protein
MTRTFVVAAVCVVGLMACSSSNAQSGTASVTGTADGNPVGTSSVIGFTIDNTVGGINNTVGATFWSFGNACSASQIGHYPGTYTELAVGALGTALPGTYPVGVGGRGQATYTVYSGTNSTCAATMQERSSGGSVTITTVSSTEVDGSFDVTFPSGDHLSGSFSAPTCNYYPGDGGSPTCG